MYLRHIPKMLGSKPWDVRNVYIFLARFYSGDGHLPRSSLIYHIPRRLFRSLVLTCLSAVRGSLSKHSIAGLRVLRRSTDYPVALSASPRSIPCGSPRPQPPTLWCPIRASVSCKITFRSTRSIAVLHSRRAQATNLRRWARWQLNHL